MITAYQFDPNVVHTQRRMLSFPSAGVIVCFLGCVTLEKAFPLASIQCCMPIVPQFKDPSILHLAVPCTVPTHPYCVLTLQRSSIEYLKLQKPESCSTELQTVVCLRVGVRLLEKSGLASRKQPLACGWLFLVIKLTTVMLLLWVLIPHSFPIQLICVLMVILSSSGGMCSVHGKVEKCVRSIDGEARRETTRKTRGQIVPEQMDFSVKRMEMWTTIGQYRL